MARIRTVALPYAAAVAGVAAITAVIAAVRPWLDLPNLGVAYLLLILLLGARYGWPPAVSAALLAFVAYDWFFVPPYGTLWISAPRELLNLVVLMVAALAGGRLAASLAAREAGAVAEAQESGILYELAIAALREPVGTALSLLCERAVTSAGLNAMALVAETDHEPAVVAGGELAPDELATARDVMASQRHVGVRLHEGQLEVLRTYPPQTGPRYVALTGGVAVLWLPGRRLPVESGRLLAALLGLASLLLDRRWAAVVGERARTLEASDRLKAAVLSSVSHELKSPLASLRAGLTTLLMPRAKLDAEQQDLVAGLDRQATRLDRLVGDLLTMSRLEAGLPPQQAPQDLGELVGAVRHSLAGVLGDLDVRVALGPGLPMVLADELQLERVLTNLLENAAEWTPPGGRITVGACPVDQEVEAWVENEGPSIPAADVEQIFEKFWTGRKGGSGLGLAICRRIVEAHGGSIRVENTERGPRFAFRLPAAGPAEMA